MPKVPLPPPSATPSPEPEPAAAPVAADAGPIDSDRLATAMAESVVPALSGMNRSLFAAGRFVGEFDGRQRFALDNVPDRIVERARNSQPDVERILTERLGQPVRVEIVGSAAGAAAPAPAAPAPKGGDVAPEGPTAAAAPQRAASEPEPEPDDEDVHIDVSELDDASDVAVSGIDKLVQAFPGAEIIEKEST